MSSAFNIPAGWREVVESLVRHIEVNECQHEDTYRGGAIWTICRDCDKKWADDRGGFKPYVRPAVLLAADKLLAASPTPPVDAVPGEPVALNLLREAVETIDTLPGYPKGADLCDRIEAYLAASVASRAGSEPVAKPDGHLHDDGCFTWAPGHRPKERDAANYAGWRAPFYLAPVAPAAAAEPSEPTTEVKAALHRALLKSVQVLPDRERAASLVAGERTPTDFALEHAEYLAGKAERLVEAVGAFHIAQVMLEEDYDADRDSDITELNVNLEAAGENLSEACRATLSGVHEFRKRRDRASAGEAQS